MLRVLSDGKHRYTGAFNAWVYASLPNNLADASIYAIRMSNLVLPSTLRAPFLDLPDHKASSAMGKRIQVPQTRVAAGFDERITQLRNVAGFTQVEPVSGHSTASLRRS